MNSCILKVVSNSFVFGTIGAVTERLTATQRDVGSIPEHLLVPGLFVSIHEYKFLQTHL